MNETRNSPDSDLDKLTRLKTLSWLSASELGLLAGALALTDFKRPQVILGEAAPTSEAHILLKGIARITCQTARGERVTIALLPPGPIPEFPSLPLGRFDFRCEAYNDCRVGSLAWNDFNGITVHSSELAFKKFHQNDLQQWYRLLLRNSGFLSLGLHERIAITLLELASDFGIKESRGALLRASFSHQDIADLVGASRPRVTEHLAQLEREHLVIRQGRQLIVRVDEIGIAITVPPLSMPGSQAQMSDRRCPKKNNRSWRQTRRRMAGCSTARRAGTAR
ncbi:MAG: Crp/Fnr family transcriptional regulator [Bryobacteraceae bacterium]